MADDIFSQPSLPGLEEWADVSTSDPLDALHQELADLRHTNQELYQQVTAPLADGRRPAPDPVGVLSLKLACLVEIVLTDESDRVNFEIVFEQRMTAALNDMLSQRRRAELLAPPPAPTMPPAAGAGLFLPK